MIINLVLWYAFIALAGWLIFPLAYRLLAFLPDRGLALARPLGLLLWSYVFWLLASLQVLQNDLGGVIMALLLVGGLSLWMMRNGNAGEMRAWLRDHRGLVLVSEILFFVLFAFMVLNRSASPEAASTEKPMELAFINAILRSPGFPPADPWLSGYSISYYYFGYVMVAMLARVSGVSGGVAFNLGLAGWFALTGLAAFSVLYNLLGTRGGRLSGLLDRAAEVRRALTALLAPLFVLLVSNFEGFLEVLHSGGIFWKRDASGQFVSDFWKWMDIQELVQPPTPPFTWEPERVTGIWWWRASRVLQDFDLSNQSREIIDEFPAFSYILGDLHPHVLAMPFVLLAIGMAFNAFLKLTCDPAGDAGIWRWLRTLDFWVLAVALGGLSFLNTWDFPIYVALFAAAVTLARYARSGLGWGLVFSFLETGFALGVAGIALYLPFYTGFASQANGLLPSLVFFTRGTFFWIMFGPLLLPIFGLLIWQVWRRRSQPGGLSLRAGLVFATVAIAGLWLLSVAWGWGVLNADPGLAGIYGAGGQISYLLSESIGRRFAAPGAWITLFLLLGAAWALIVQQRTPPVEARDNDEPEQGDEGAANPAAPFVLLLVLLGGGLALFPEFFYLRDQFGWRMNTIFKFYFQVWVVWALAASYASALLLQVIPSSWKRLALQAAWLVMLLLALIYPYFGFGSRIKGYSISSATLDGTAYLERSSPDEMAAIRWLQQAPYGVVAEAVGGSYTGFARVSTMSGLPAVLGWPGHESQWRGGGKEIGSREPDMASLYKARTWDDLQALIQRYQIRYIYVGAYERSQYRPNEDLLYQYLQPVFRNDSVTIFEVPRYNSVQDLSSQP
jgi:YYY domain-containing protein